MKKVVCSLLTLVLAVQLCTAGEAAHSGTQNDFDGYLVRMSQGGPVLFSQEQEGVDYVLPGLYKVEDPALVEQLLESGLAEYAEPNYIIRLFDYELYEVDTSTSWTDVLMRTDYAAELGLDGTGVRVAVIDSGLYAENLNLQNANIAAGYDYVEGSAETMSDGLGHGTKVTQMIVGDGRNGTVRGTAPEATIVPLRCFDDAGSAKTENLLRAMSDAVNVYDCDVVNMSWGFTVPSQELLAAVQEINDAGAIAVAAAGNVNDGAGMPQGTVTYPAAYEGVIGIGSVTSSLEVASTSQQTSSVYACAPGDSVAFYYNNDLRYLSSGTSFAAPAFSGIAALLRQAVPQMNTAALRELIWQRAVDLGEEGYDTAYGHGFVQMDELMGDSWMDKVNDLAVGWLRDDGSALVQATYDEDGRMESCTITAADKALDAFALTLDEGGNKNFFLWTSAFVPIVESIRG